MRGVGVGAVLTWFYRPRLRHVQQELRVLTAKISGLDGKEKEKGEDVRRAASRRAAANQFSYLPQSANEVIKIKVMQKGRSRTTAAAAGQTGLSQTVVTARKQPAEGSLRSGLHTKTKTS